MQCAIGRGGFIAAKAKTEGDGKSPVGRWPLRRVHYRADRLAPPQTVLPMRKIRPEDGWCDAPGDPNYNRLIERPYPASHEVLWRDDHVYDIILEIGHNDSPPIDTRGSAIFVHLKRVAYAPTEGCIALALNDMLDLLAFVQLDMSFEIAF